MASEMSQANGPKRMDNDVTPEAPAITRSATVTVSKRRRNVSRNGLVDSSSKAQNVLIMKIQ